MVTMYAWWLILAKSSIRARLILVFSHLKSPVSLSCKQHSMHFWSNQHSMTSWMTTISVRLICASICAVTIRRYSVRLSVYCENCPRRQSTSGYLIRKRTRRRQASTTSITSSFNGLIIYDKAYQMTNQGLRVDYEDLLRKVHKLGLSPIPLWKSFCTQHIPRPVSFLGMISAGEIVISCQKVK